MKTKAIFLASVLLFSCHVSGSDAGEPEQHAQSLSSASQGSDGNLGDRMLSPHWQDDGNTTAENSDLWNTISDKLKMKVPNNPRIREQKLKYLKDKSYLHEVTAQAEPYMYWIVDQIQKRKMPMELVLLPIVESAFDPHATSNANAAGIWQIVASTGRNYGLKQTQWYDGRRDVVASTTVALNMLQRLNKMFHGDWLLTVAAYNSGEGRVLNAMKVNRARGKPTDFWSLSLPKETTVYIPKMLALSQLIKNPKQYGIKLPKANNGRALAKVNVGKQINLTQVASMTGIPVGRLKSFNAGYKRGTTAPSGPQYVMIPKSHVVRLKDSLATHDIQAVQPIAVAENSTVSQYKVRSGDTLSTIAAKHGLSVRALKSMNNLRTASVRIGQTLELGGQSKNSRQQLADNGNSITYKIRKGDSLSSIAERHGVNIKDVLRWNGSLTRDEQSLQPGKKLTLFVNNS